MRHDEPGDRSFSIRCARERAREEGCPIYVLRWADRGQSYTASNHPRLRSGPTEMHGYCEKRGRTVGWVPKIIMDLDDVIAYLRSQSTEGYDLAAAEIEKLRGDKGV